MRRAARGPIPQPVSLAITGTFSSSASRSMAPSAPAKYRSPPSCTISWAGFMWMASASAPTRLTSSVTASVESSRACTAPMLPMTRVVGATSRTR